MATLAELMQQYGLEGDSDGQTKTAAAKAPNSAEVGQVLESLGLSDNTEGIEKVANTNEKKGVHMGLTDIYEELFGDVAPVAGQEKVASAEQTEEVNEASQLFGELTAHYFSAAKESYLQKIAGSVESHLGQDEEQPLEHLGNESQLGKSMGKIEDPHMPVNHSASGGAAMQTATGNTSPYSLKEMALKKQILKGMAAAPVGDIKD